MKEIRATLFAPGLRLLERALPVAALLAVLYPIAFVRAVLHRLIKGKPNSWVAADHGRGQPLPDIPFLHRLPTYLNRTFEFIPDRLSDNKWRSRCRITGLEAVTQARLAGRGAILAFAHIGPFELLRSWLRAAGLPVSMFVGGSAEGRTEMTRQKDRWALFPEVPPAFHRDQLGAAIRELIDGCPLAMAIDVPTGRQVDVSLAGGGSFAFATGPIRLARRHGAALFPCTILNDGPWRYVIELDPPLPAALLAQDDATVGAALLERMLPTLRRHADQWAPSLAGRFRGTTQSPSGKVN